MNYHLIKKYELNSKLASNKTITLSVGNESFTFMKGSSHRKVNSTRNLIKDNFISINGIQMF